ncbi:MAG: ATP-binding domain-containing protein [Myxococcales bacterium]|nr:ATP-binding domain-containing protein [Myxococcales bacterium]
MSQDVANTSDSTRDNADPSGADADRDRIVAEEQKVLNRVVRTLELRTHERATAFNNSTYDAELISLRDQINEARLEDVPPLIEEMERLQAVAARRAKVTEGVVDHASPYFGRLVLEENDKKREVLIGKSTFLDPKTGVRIVDWRDAPVSRIYYRYDEGDDYEENFGGRDLEGEVITRRSVAIADQVLQRIGAPQGTFFRSRGQWVRMDDSAARLGGGQGAAPRPEDHHRPGRLGTGQQGGGEDKHLPEIAALIDPQQFDLITRPSSGLVVIQGGAGSGKTTIGLHRMAYLAFQDTRRFTADRMLCIVFNDALARYISRVLPALGVPGVLVTTYERWAHRLRTRHLEGLPTRYCDLTPVVVTRMKKHPALLHLISLRVEAMRLDMEARIETAIAQTAHSELVLREWRSLAKSRPGQRAHLFLRWVGDRKGPSKVLSLTDRHALERVAGEVLRETKDVVGVWADILTDREALRDAFGKEGVLTDAELDEAYRWCSRNCARVVAYRDARLEESQAEPEEAEAHEGVDGEDEREIVELDQEDDTLLLRLLQLLRGGLSRKGSALRYEHVFVDEAQDLSPVEMSVVLDTVSSQRSVTLAGDVAQRLHMHNGFSDWRGVLRDLGLDHVSVEPLRLTYRSTQEIIDFATDALGPLRNEEEGKASRHGAPVELFRFGHSGDAVGFLAEALRELVQAEPKASIAVIARYSEQADLYFKGLQRAEVPNLRRIAEQDFPFRPGVDVTDVRQVKGLEFDYVILVDVNRSSYGEDDESRHLLHIAATRAAHQLWVITTADPSHLIPEAMRERSY